MKVVHGDITLCCEKILLQQVNCVNEMNSGVAKAIFTKWPIVKREYHKYCLGKSPNNLLSTIQPINTKDGMLIINVFSQLNRGRDGRQYTDYEAVRVGFIAVLKLLEEIFWDDESIGGDIALPYLYGCGLGGGDWKIVSNIIGEVFGDRAVCYKFP